jgi:hypothetical protein
MKAWSLLTGLFPPNQTVRVGRITIIACRTYWWRNPETSSSIQGGPVVLFLYFHINSPLLLYFEEGSFPSTRPVYQYFLNKPSVYPDQD